MYKYFHRVAKSHRRYNAIELVHSDDHVIEDQADIKNHVVHYHETFVSEQCSWMPELDGLAFDSRYSECKLVGECLRSRCSLWLKR